MPRLLGGVLFLVAVENETGRVAFPLRRVVSSRESQLRRKTAGRGRNGSSPLEDSLSNRARLDELSRCGRRHYSAQRWNSHHSLTKDSFPSGAPHKTQSSLPHALQYRGGATPTTASYSIAAEDVARVCVGIGHGSEVAGVQEGGWRVEEGGMVVGVVVGQSLGSRG